MGLEENGGCFKPPSVQPCHDPFHQQANGVAEEIGRQEPHLNTSLAAPNFCRVVADARLRTRFVRRSRGQVF